jgi:hypothetical protein
MNSATQAAWINLIAKVGLDAAIVIIEAINSAPTEAEALASLKKAATKTPEQYVAEELARRGQAG